MVRGGNKNIMEILEKIKEKNVQLPKWSFWLFVALSVVLIGYIVFWEFGFVRKILGEINILNKLLHQYGNTMD